jgi:hypothetical protein
MHREAAAIGPGFPAMSLHLRDALLQHDGVVVPGHPVNGAAILGRAAHGTAVLGHAAICPGSADCPSSHPSTVDVAFSFAGFVLCSSIDDGASVHNGEHLGGHDDGCYSAHHWCCCLS